MRNDGIWHPRLIEVIATLAHTETLVVADAGLPVPPGVECIHLIWSRGEPGLLPVLDAVLKELCVEAATVASELDDATRAELESELSGLPVTRLPHAEFKSAVGQARAVVRTGETTPFANVILRAGVAF